MKIEKAPLPKRTYEEINQDRRRLIEIGYEAYPEAVYPRQPEAAFPLSLDYGTPEGRKTIFDIYYLHDAGLAVVQKSQPYIQSPATIPRNRTTMIQKKTTAA